MNMAKKLFIVWLSLTIVLFSSISIYADQNIQGDFFIRDVVVNGERIVNYNLQFPFLTYNNTTYLPLTEDLGRICGFEVSMDWESRTLKLIKKEPTQKNLSNNTYKGSSLQIALQVVTDVKVVAESAPAAGSAKQQTEGAAQKQEAPAETTVSGSSCVRTELIASGGCQSAGEEETLPVSPAAPVLAKGKYFFIPLKMLADSSTFRWNLFYDSNFGICISTKEGVAAQSYWNRQKALYNQGLAAYIRQYNPQVSRTYSEYLVFLFKRAAEVYRIDEKLLIAVAHKESTFNPGAQSRAGALGIMQIMPATGARYGFSRTQLLDPQISINTGAMILSERIAAYGGDAVKGLSAYNQGSVSVNRGSYSTAYASRIMAAYGGTHKFLNLNGYTGK